MSESSLRESLKTWQPPSHWQRLTAIDAHTAGEPLRVIVSGWPEMPGDTILDRRRHARMHLDPLRQTLLWEPRGHREMYGCILTLPVNPGSDLGVLFMHNEGYSTMCGHGIIAIAKVALQTGLLPVHEPETRLYIDTPAGTVTVHAAVSQGRIGTIRFENVPSFVVDLDAVIEVPEWGDVTFDLAFGGAYYLYVDANQFNMRCTPDEYTDLVDIAMSIKEAFIVQKEIRHPGSNDLSFLYGVLFIAPPQQPHHHSRNVCVFADGQVDRSPTGTGISGRLAIHHAREEIGIDQAIVVESLIGTTFTGRIKTLTQFGGRAAVIPEIAGTAHITGRHEFLIDPDDPLRHGFLI